VRTRARSWGEITEDVRGNLKLEEEDGARGGTGDRNVLTCTALAGCPEYTNESKTHGDVNQLYQSLDRVAERRD
jgi:hypothetical protein